MNQTHFEFDTARPIRSKAPAQRHSETSVAAAKAIESKSETLRRKVFEFILSRGDYGATDEEMQDLIPMKPNTQRPRRVELQDGKAGREIVIFKQGTRPTKSGSSAAVWKVIRGKSL